MKHMDTERLEKVEELLRQRRGTQLSPEFTRNVMQSIRRLPAPVLLAPPRSWHDYFYALRLLGGGGLAALLLVVATGVALFLPGANDVFAAAQWELADWTLSLSFGEAALSVSALSVLGIVIGGLAMIAVGTFSARNHLLGV
jgi:hypothetical protein